MKGRSFMRMRTLVCLVGLLALTVAAGLPPAAAQTPPPSPPAIPSPDAPFILRATLQVSGPGGVSATTLTGVNSAYTISVYDTKGNPLPDASTNQSSLSYGAVVPGRFEYQIPMTVDTSLTPAAVPTTACIAISHSGTPLTVTYPAQGSCATGQGQITGLVSGDAMGFGSGIYGDPNTSSYTFSSPIAATNALVPPAVSVQCNSNPRNSTTPELVYASGVPVGGTPVSDTSCVVLNAGWQPLSITGMTVSGRGFSLASPSAPSAQSPIPVSFNSSTAIGIGFAPCGVGVQTGTLTITSNDPKSPFTVPLTGTGTTTITLNPGWNLVSMPGVPENTTPASLLSGILSNVSVVWGYTPGASQPWTYYVPGGSTNTLTTMTAGQGYWIYITGISAGQTLQLNVD